MAKAPTFDVAALRQKTPESVSPSPPPSPPPPSLPPPPSPSEQSSSESLSTEPSQSPSPKEVKFDTRYYKQVEEIQKQLGNLLQISMTSGLYGKVEKSEPVQFLMNKFSTVDKSKTSFLDRVKQLSMGKHPVDGKWGQLTNNALKASLALAKGLIGFAAKTGEPLKAMTVDDYNAMKQILKDKLSTPEKAVALLPLIKKLQEAVEEFSSSVDRHIKSLSSDAKLTVNNALTLTPQEQEFINSRGNSVIQGLAYNRQVSYNDLSSLDKFKTFLRNAGQGDVSADTASKVLQYLKQQANSLASAGY